MNRYLLKNATNLTYECFYDNFNKKKYKIVTQHPCVTFDIFLRQNDSSNIFQNKTFRNQSVYFLVIINTKLLFQGKHVDNSVVKKTHKQEICEWISK